MLVDALDRSRAALVVLDVDGVVERWGLGAARLWGWPAEAVVGRPWTELGMFVDTARRAQASAIVRRVLAGESAVLEWTSRDADGGTKRIESVLEAVRTPHGEVVGVLCLSFDLTRLDTFEQALVREALHDQLTGLPGRSLVAQAILAAQGAGTGAAVLFVDLDGFKAVNDRYGHRAGDDVLVEVGRRLRAAVRNSDVVGRIGGDEFVAVASLEGGDTVGVDLADRIRAALAAPVLLASGDTVQVSGSVGVALSRPGEPADAVLRRADEAMYGEKERGA